MKTKPTLSIAPYYGGKARMAHFIADRLDYANSDVFVTPFGGMCRVLLNKPRHPVECYNDYSSGLNALMRVLSDNEKASELIHRLYYNTEYSEDEFIKQKAIFDNAEKDLEEQEREKLRKLLIDNKVIRANTANKLIDEILQHPIAPKASNKATRKVETVVKNGLASLQTTLERDSAFREIFQKQFENCWGMYELKKTNGIMRTLDMEGMLSPGGCSPTGIVSEMELAVATYVVFQQSMDGMGLSFSKSKFKSNEQYQQHILKLYECAERLRGVHIYQIDAIDYFREFMFVDVGLPNEEVDPGFLMMNEWVNNPRVMMYCDPSYISPDEERDLLEGINISAVSSLSDAIKAKYDGKKQPKNLGKIYARSFSYNEQENFLRCIQYAKCKILVSNYDLQLYNKYLNEETGWRKEKFNTTTGVGSTKDNKRVEVIWYNY